MKSGSFVICLVILVFLDLCPAYGGPLAWPVRQDDGVVAVIRGSYGDLRMAGFDLRFHKGIDIYKPAGSYVYAAKPNLEIVQSRYHENLNNWCYVLEDANGHQYSYGHVSQGFNPEELRLWKVGDIVPDTLNPFCTIWNFPDSPTGPHLEFKVLKGHNGKITNPLWQDPSFDYLPCCSSPGPKIYDGTSIEKGIAFGVYKQPLDDSNPYYCPLRIESGEPVDVMVYANTKDGNGEGPVGVCVLEMWYERLSSGGPPQDPPDANWTHRMVLTADLPNSANIADMFALQNHSTEGVDTCRVVPQTVQSTTDDRMWYIITNFNSAGELDPTLQLDTGWSGSTSYYWIWFRVTDHLGTPVIYGPIPAEAHPGPAEAFAYFSAVSTNIGIELSWRTSDPTAVTGFVVCRMEDHNGSFEPISAVLTPSAGEAGIAEYFRYVDSKVIPGKEYTYRIDMRLNGEWQTVWETVTAIWLSHPNSGRLVVVSPSPFRDFVEIRLLAEPDRGDRTAVLICDCAGREIWSSSFSGKDKEVLRWDGVTRSGAPAAPGIYFCYVSQQGWGESVKVIRLR